MATHGARPAPTYHCQAKMKHQELHQSLCQHADVKAQAIFLKSPPWKDAYRCLTSPLVCGPQVEHKIQSAEFGEGFHLELQKVQSSYCTLNLARVRACSICLQHGSGVARPSAACTQAIQPSVPVLAAGAKDAGQSPACVGT